MSRKISILVSMLMCTTCQYPSEGTQVAALPEQTQHFIALLGSDVVCSGFLSINWAAIWISRIYDRSSVKCLSGDLASMILK